MKTYKQDHQLMDLLKLKEISRVICDTNMGTLKLRLRKGETSYKFVLDAVELDKDTNKEVFELLYPVKESRFTGFDPIEELPKHSLSQIIISPGTKTQETLDIKEIKDNKDGTHTLKITKPKGRPKGTKNKKTTPNK